MPWREIPLCLSLTRDRLQFLKKDMKDGANKDDVHFKASRTNQKETPLDVSSTSTTTILET